MTRAFTLLFGLLVLVTSACSSAGGGAESDPPVSCCALARYCESCSYCTALERSIAASGDESACRPIIADFIDDGRYCSPSDRSLPTFRFLAECAGEGDGTGGDAQCCALRSYCDRCSFCERSERAIGDSGNSEACGYVIAEHLESGRYCSPSDHTLRTEALLASCSE